MDHLKNNVTYPSKRTINLAIREKSPFRPQKLIPLLLLILFAAALFAKFAVVDRLNEYYRLQAEAEKRQLEIEECTRALEEYDDVVKEYSRYSVSWMSDDLKSSVPRAEILTLIEKELEPNCSIYSVYVSDNTLSVLIGGLKLEDASDLVGEIRARKDVCDVAVYSADTHREIGLNAAISMEIEMILPEGGAQ